MSYRSRYRDRSRRWERYLELASEAGSIAMNLGDRPTRVQLIGLGLRALGFAVKVRGERRRMGARDPWNYFENPGSSREWIAIPDEFHALVLEHVTDVDVERDHWDGDQDSFRVLVGAIGGERIGWIADSDGEPTSGPFLRAARERETYRALGARIWQRIGTRQVAFGRGGLCPDPLAGDPRTAGDQIRELGERLARFREHGMRRSCLLVGPPGTGKSTGIRYLAGMLGLSSLRVDLAALSRQPGVRVDDQAPLWLEALLKLLEPQLLVLDDLDRVTCGGELLHFLELAAATCQVVLATANGTEAMLGAALRPGRFDEVVRVDRLDRCLLRSLVGDDDELAERVRDLPVAYVAELVKRREVLGRERALAELEELCARRALVEQQKE